jgi:hypothetical protein
MSAVAPVKLFGAMVNKQLISGMAFAALVAVVGLMAMT